MSERGSHVTGRYICGAVHAQYRGLRWSVLLVAQPLAGRRMREHGICCSPGFKSKPNLACSYTLSVACRCPAPPPPISCSRTRHVHEVPGLRLPRHLPGPPAVVGPPPQREHGAEHTPRRPRGRRLATVFPDRLDEHLGRAGPPGHVRQPEHPLISRVHDRGDAVPRHDGHRHSRVCTAVPFHFSFRLLLFGAGILLCPYSALRQCRRAA